MRKQTSSSKSTVAGSTPAGCPTLLYKEARMSIIDDATLTPDEKRVSIIVCIGITLLFVGMLVLSIVCFT